MIQITDKQRCELSFIGRIIYLLILGGISGNSQHELANAALEIAEEPLNGVFDKSKLKRRVIRMEESTIRPFTNKSHGEKIVLICFYFINMVIDTGTLIVPANGGLANIVEYMLSLIDIEDPTTQKRMASAEKQAKKWLETLQKDGYYR